MVVAVFVFVVIVVLKTTTFLGLDLAQIGGFLDLKAGGGVGEEQLDRTASREASHLEVLRR